MNISTHLDRARCFDCVRA